jgi:hypothetical protein
LQYAKLSNTYQNTILDAVLNNQGTAKDIIAGKGAATMDEVTKGIYDQFKDVLPKD